MPESEKIHSRKWGVAAAMAIILLLAGAGAGWWVWTLKTRSFQSDVVNLAPKEPALERPSPVQEPHGIFQDAPSLVTPPNIDPDPPTPIRAPVIKPVMAQAEENVTGDVQVSSPGVIDEFSRLRTELERKKLQVEIARQNEQLRSLEIASMPARVPAAPTVSRQAVPLRVQSVFGRGRDLRAVIEQPGKGTATVAVGDRIGGETVATISADAVVVRSGRKTRILAFK